MPCAESRGLLYKCRQCDWQGEKSYGLEHLARKHQEPAPYHCQACDVEMSSERHAKIHEGQQGHKRKTKLYKGYPISYDPTRKLKPGLKVCSREESIEYWKREEREPEINQSESVQKSEVEVQQNSKEINTSKDQEKTDHASTVVSTVCHQEIKTTEETNPTDEIRNTAEANNLEMNEATNMKHKNKSERHINKNKPETNNKQNKNKNKSSNQNDKNKNDSSQKQNDTNIKSENEIKSNNTNSKENNQNIKKQKLSITISTGEDKNKQVEFVELEEESEDPLDQFEDAMEEDDHIEITNQENHIKSPESIVTDQENQRTHEDKNTGNVVRQPQDKTPEKITTKRKAPSSIPVSLSLSPTKRLRAELELSPDSSLSSPSLSESQFNPDYNEVDTPMNNHKDNHSPQTNINVNNNNQVNNDVIVQKTAEIANQELLKYLAEKPSLQAVAMTSVANQLIFTNKHLMDIGDQIKSEQSSRTDSLLNSTLSQLKVVCTNIRDELKESNRLRAQEVAEFAKLNKNYENLTKVIQSQQTTNAAIQVALSTKFIKDKPQPETSNQLEHSILKMVGQFHEDWSAFEQDKTTSLEGRQSAWPYFDTPQDKSKSWVPEAQSRTITVTELQPQASTSRSYPNLNYSYNGYCKNLPPAPRYTYSDRTSRQDRR